MRGGRPAGTGGAAELSAAKDKTRKAGSAHAPASALPFMFTLLGETLHVNGVVGAHGSFGPVHFHDMTHVRRGRRLRVHAAVTPRIVLFGHQHIERALLREQPDWLSLLHAFLAA